MAKFQFEFKRAGDSSEKFKMITADNTRDAIAAAQSFMESEQINGGILYYPKYDNESLEVLKQFKPKTKHDIIRDEVRELIENGCADVAIEWYAESDYWVLVEFGLKQWQPEQPDNPNAAALTEAFFAKYLG